MRFIFRLWLPLILLFPLQLWAQEVVVQKNSVKNSTSLELSTEVPAPLFSTPSGFFTDPFFLEITTPEPGAIIYYTLDGSTPGLESNIYNQPLNIAGRQGVVNDISMIPTNNNTDTGPPYYEAWQPPLGEVFKVNVVRAVVFKEGMGSSPVTTATYLIDDQGSQRYSLPVFSINTDWENLFDPDTGIFIVGNHNNYFQRGPEWERRVHLEFFEPHGVHAFSQDVGIRIHGGTTRSRPRKSLRIYSRSEYGKGRMRHQLFPDKPVNDFNRLLLRNSGNDWDISVFRDGFLQHLAKDLNVDIQYYRPAIVFVNGEYWGIHNMRDRYDEHYIETHYGIHVDDMIMLQNNLTTMAGNTYGRQHYTDMITYISQNSMANQQHYKEITNRLDPWSFIDAQITNIFAMNTDWPGNNNVYWRYINNGYDPLAPAHRDGRWRWMMLDMDFGFLLPFFYVVGLEQGVAHNTLAMAADPGSSNWNNPPWSTLLLRRLLQNNGFRNDFINRFADMLNTRFHQQQVIGVIDSIQNILQLEMQEHSDRWRRPTSLNNWNENLEVMRAFANERPAYVRQHIRSFFNLQGTALVTLSVNDPAMGEIQMNTVKVHPNPTWSGIYFTGIPVNIIAHPRPGYRLASWEGVGALPGDTLTLMLTGSISVTAVFEPSGEFPGDELNPAAYKLQKGPYIFNHWDPNAAEGHFPAHMAFQQSMMNDPGLQDEMTHAYHLPYSEYHSDDLGSIGHPYRLTSRTRINGLWDKGISFINTGRGRDVGAAVLALDTRGINQVRVSWTGATLMANSRAYAIRLQYRVGVDGPFADVGDSQGNPVEYHRNESPGHFTEFESIVLPQEVDNQPYVLLRWKYYHTGLRHSQESGERDMLRLDNIMVTQGNATAAPLQPKHSTQGNLFNHPNPFRESTRISFELDVPSQTVLAIHDQRGIQVAVVLNQHMDAGTHELELNAASFPAGVYFYSLLTDSYSVTKRMVLIK